MKILAVYYSRTGHTKKAGEMIAAELKCDREEIIDIKDRSGFFGYMSAGKDATLKDITKIEPLKNDPALYDLVVIGTPIHSFSLSAPVRTYLKENKDRFKNVAFFCTCGGMGIKRTLAEMEKVCGKKPMATMDLTEKELKNEKYIEKIRQFINHINS